MELRRQFELLPDDRQFLEDYGLPWETVVDGSQWVLIHNFPTQHEGYNHDVVTIAIRLETGYPNAQLDMVYVYPLMARKDNQPIKATEARQDIDGKSYQRWSRHRTPNNPWLPGFDGLGTHIFLIEDWLAREFEKCP
jgi:Prokaryotic E2 family E